MGVKRSEQTGRLSQSPPSSKPAFEKRNVKNQNAGNSGSLTFRGTLEIVMHTRFMHTGLLSKQGEAGKEDATHTLQLPVHHSTVFIS